MFIHFDTDFFFFLIFFLYRLKKLRLKI